MNGTDEQEFLPHGKYKSVPLDEVPLDYLRWIIDPCDSGTEFYELAEAEFIQRKSRGQA